MSQTPAKTSRPEANPDPLLTVPETVDYLRISRNLLHNETTAGRITPTRLGRSVRYRRSEIERYLSAQAGSVRHD